MKFKIESSLLKKALESILPVVGSGPVYIYSTVRFWNANGKLYLSAYNGYIFAIKMVRPSLDTDPDINFCVEAAKLSIAVSQIGGDVQFEVISKPHKITKEVSLVEVVMSGENAGIYRCSIKPGNDFPRPHVAETEQIGEVNGSMFVMAMASAAKFMSKEELKPIVYGTTIRAGSDGLTVYGSNGGICYRAQFGNPFEDRIVILSYGASKTLSALTKFIGGDLSLSVNDRNLVITSQEDGVRLYCVLSDADPYSHWEDFFNIGEGTKYSIDAEFSVDGKSLRNTVRTIDSYTGLGHVKMTFKSEEVSLVSDKLIDGYKCDESVRIEGFSGAEQTLVFNVGYLSKCILDGSTDVYLDKGQHAMLLHFPESLPGFSEQTIIKGIVQ